MSKFIDLRIRQALNAHLLTVGAGDAGSVSRTVDLSPAGVSGLTTASIHIQPGEYSTVTPPQDRDWVEPFLIKSPQIAYSGKANGLQKKTFQYTLWIKTDKSKDLFYAEVLAGMLEEHFPNNQLIKAGDLNIKVLRTYQQSNIQTDKSSGRLFNRVFIDCEVYYENK